MQSLVFAQIGWNAHRRSPRGEGDLRLASILPPLGDQGTRGGLSTHPGERNNKPHFPKVVDLLAAAACSHGAPGRDPGRLNFALNAGKRLQSAFKDAGPNSVLRGTSIRERMNVESRAELFNLLNRAKFNTANLIVFTSTSPSVNAAHYHALTVISI